MSLCCRYAAIAFSTTGFILSVSVDTDRSKKHGQTCRAVVGAEILTSCNFKASLFDHLVITFWVATTAVLAVSFFWTSPIIS